MFFPNYMIITMIILAKTTFIKYTIIEFVLLLLNSYRFTEIIFITFLTIYVDQNTFSSVYIFNSP